MAGFVIDVHRHTGPEVPEQVWEFAVSGYRVLPRFLAARAGEALDAALQRAILDIAWRIEELLHWLGQADAVLEAALVAPLTGTELGLAPLPADPATPLDSPRPRRSDSKA